MVVAKPFNLASRLTANIVFLVNRCSHFPSPLRSLENTSATRKILAVLRACYIHCSSCSILKAYDISDHVFRLRCKN